NLFIVLSFIIVLMGIYTLISVFANTPQETRITNIGSNSFTITWTTKNKDVGTVLYSENPSFKWIPSPLSYLFAKKAYDDRDYNNAELTATTLAQDQAKQGNSPTIVAIT